MIKSRACWKVDCFYVIPENERALWQISGFPRPHVNRFRTDWFGRRVLDDTKFSYSVI